MTSQNDVTPDPEYPPLESLAAIGDGRSMGLLAPDGTLEWFCPRRFDNPALLWSLLDRKQGGFLRVSAKDVQHSTMTYLAKSAVIEYQWKTDNATARAQVCMEWPRAEGQQRLLWSITGVNGVTEIFLKFSPKADFGREQHHVRLGPRAVYIKAGNDHMSFQSDVAVEHNDTGLIHTRHMLNADETINFCLSFAVEPSAKATPVDLSTIPQRIENTHVAWTSWADTIHWQGEYQNEVLRSAITLKLLMFEPTGALLAAGTTGLPEMIAGTRNWDYRYTWFRDGGLVLTTFSAIGRQDEAHKWAEWMENAILYHEPPLRPLYTIDGRQPPAEETLEHIEGYRRSTPVRVGNAARDQLQLDIYGEILACVYICDSMSDKARRRHWQHLRKAADFIADHWHEPDNGIWEVRSGRQHFVHSKVAAWCGLRRALWLRHRHDLDGDSANWQRQAEAIRAEVMQRGISEDGERFTRAYDDPGVDASLLLLARYGFVKGTDPLFQNTLDAVKGALGLAEDPRLLRRYSTSSDDGLPGEEGAFLICSFWLVDALIRAERDTEAREIFNYLLSLAGPTGLYAEQIEAHTSAQLGNFPQAFSHVGLINAAIRINNEDSQKLHPNEPARE